MNETKATRYQRLRRRARGAGLVSGVVVLTALAVTPGSRGLDAWVRSVVRTAPATVQPAARLALFVACICGLWEVVALPAVLYLGLHVERRYRKAEHTLSALVLAHLQSASLTMAVALVVSVIVRLSMAAAGLWWWSVAGVLITVSLIAAFRAAPSLLPLAGELRPLARPQLSARIGELAQRARVPILGLYELRMGEDERPTAFIAGLGSTRKAVLSETIAREWSDEEAEVVLAHELAHHAHHDLWRTLALEAVILSLALFVADRTVTILAPMVGHAGPRALSAMPLLGIVVGIVWLAATPLRHLQSRRQERHADRFALAMTGHGDAFRTAVRRLGALHLAEERPSSATRWLYHRHPSMEERLASAAGFNQKQDTGPKRRVV